MTDAAPAPETTAATAPAPDAPPTTGEQAPQTETPAPSGPSAAEVQRAKLDALLARNAERKAKLAEREKQLAEREGKLPKADSYRENPIAAIEQMGLTPVEALDALVSQANREGTELGKLEKEFRASLRAAEERAARAEQLAQQLAEERAREREEQQTRAQAEQAQRAEAAMIEHLQTEAYGDLARFYSREELLTAANHYAEQLHAAGKRVTFADVGAAILASHKASIARYSPSSAPSTAAPSTPPAPSAKPKSLSPDLASQSATRAPRSETFEERVRRIAERESRR